MDLTKTRALVEGQEGSKLKMYRDSKGIETIGVGHNLRDKPISERVKDLMFDDDLGDAIEDCGALFPNFVAADYRSSCPINSDARQAALISMAYNLGRTRLASFKKMRSAVVESDWERAADEILDSKAARNPLLKERYEILAKMMRTGEWPGSDE